MNWILTLILLISSLQLIVFVLFLRALRGVYVEIMAFVSSPDDKTLSPLAKFIGDVSRSAGIGMAQEIKTTLMGKASGDVRLDKAAQGELALAVAGQNPKLGALLSSFPALGKMVRKNPSLLDLAMQFAPGLMGGKPAQPQEQTGNNHTVDNFSLK